MLRIRKLSVVGALLLAVGAMIVPATSAQASTNCSGRIIFAKEFTYAGSPIAELVVYWDASTGNNCARFNHLGASYGVAAETYAYILKCNGTTPATTTICTEIDHSFGNYSYYAGPVKAYAPNNCVEVWGGMTWHGTDIYYNTGPIGC